MAELMAMMGAAAPATAGAATGAASAGASGIAGGTAGLFGSAAAPASAMSQSLLSPAAATPFVTEAAGSSEALAKFLSPETFGLGAPPGAGSPFPWDKVMATSAMSQMKNGSEKTVPGGMSGRPPGYNPSEPMEKQFARIMGWLQENGGRL